MIHFHRDDDGCEWLVSVSVVALSIVAKLHPWNAFCLKTLLRGETTDWDVETTILAII